MITKKETAVLLSLSLLFTGASTLAAQSADIPAVITQEDLEKLKAELQKEIDEYGNYDTDFSFGNTSSPIVYDVCYEESVLEDAWSEAGDCMDGAEFMCETEAFPDSGLYGWDYSDPFNTEEYAVLKEAGFLSAGLNPLSTFAADVDTGSFCNMRRMIRDGSSLTDIPSGAVRTEELLNYFDFTVDDINRSDGKFSLQHELTACPWNPENQLLLMTVRTNEADRENEGNNFVFLIDTSGSMDEAEKIAMAKCSFKLLSYTLTENDRVSIVTYAGDTYTALDSCPGNDYDRICEALDSIVPYGGTNGSGGITAAYELAEKNFIEGGNNRVFIASDGDMNLGITSTSGLVDLITEKKKSGIFLTTLGFGSGNYSDQNMESIADAGNGNYFYIDCLDEAQHVLIEKLKETTVTVAKDVKFQAEFNPLEVESYRLIGYENRNVANEDFQNDAVDGGEVGAGQQVTVLYEIKRTNGAETAETESDLKYQTNRQPSGAALSGELLTLSINYKEPEADQSSTESYAVSSVLSEETSKDMHLAMSIAELSMMIHNSPFAENITFDNVKEEANAGKISTDIYRIGYLQMLDQLSERLYR